MASSFLVSFFLCFFFSFFFSSSSSFFYWIWNTMYEKNLRCLWTVQLNQPKTHRSCKSENGEEISLRLWDCSLFSGLIFLFLTLDNFFYHHVQEVLSQFWWRTLNQPKLILSGRRAKVDTFTWCVQHWVSNCGNYHLYLIELCLMKSISCK